MRSRPSRRRSRSRRRPTGRCDSHATSRPPHPSLEKAKRQSPRRDAFRSRGPRTNHRVKPSSASRTTVIIQINFFSLGAKRCMRLCTLPPDCRSSKCDRKRTIRQGFCTTADEQSTPADRYCINRIYSILCCLDDTLGSCLPEIVRWPRRAHNRRPGGLRYRQSESWAK